MKYSLELRRLAKQKESGGKKVYSLECNKHSK